MNFSHEDLLWAVRECERQHTDLRGLARMLQALGQARRYAERHQFPRISHVTYLALIVEPRNSFYDSIEGHLNYRRTPVTFAWGGSSCPWTMIPEAVERWFENTGVSHRRLSYSDGKEFVRGLLQIHPWEDGNGRVAALLYNWVTHQFTQSLEALPEMEF